MAGQPHSRSPTIIDDHIAGVEALAAATGARVIGACGRCRTVCLALDEALVAGDIVRIGMDEGHVIDVPGHTIGHIAFHFPASRAVFTADSLMACGCGRLFEGTPAQMWDSLSALAQLPPETLVCSGHEYTQSNIRFALSVDTGNPALQARAARVEVLRAAGLPTVPVPLSEELATNPFLRASDACDESKSGNGSRT
jgi:hydroxyacylglutathione hydrolase